MLRIANGGIRKDDVRWTGLRALILAGNPEHKKENPGHHGRQNYESEDPLPADAEREIHLVQFFVWSMKLRKKITEICPLVQ